MTFVCKPTHDGRENESDYYIGLEEEDKFVSKE